MKLNQETGVEPKQVEQLSDDVIRVPLRTQTLPPATRTNAYLVDTGEGWLVVDPAPTDPAELERLGAAIDTYCDRVVGALVTHHHHDHVGGLPWWTERCDAPVFAHPTTIQTLQAQPTFSDVRWRAHDGSPEAAGVGHARIVHSPGHCAGHLVVLTQRGDCIAGDVVAGIGTVVVAAPDGDMADYCHTLEQLMGMVRGAVHPSHGPSEADGVGRLRQYLEHRGAREAAIVAALEPTSPMSVAQVTAFAYADVPQALHFLAQMSVSAHLRKLRLEGRAVVDEAGLWSSAD